MAAGLYIFNLVSMPIAGGDLRSDLGVGPVGVDWVINVYPLGVTAALLPAGAVGARVGHPRILWAGAWLTALFATCAAAAPDPAALIVARVGLGVGGGLLFGPLLAILAGNAPDRFHRAIGDYATAIGVSTGASPVLAAVLVEAFGWRAVPALSALVALGPAALVGRAHRRRPGTVATGPIDVAGCTTFAVAVTAAVFAAMEASSLGWLSPLVVVACAAALAFALATVAIERARPNGILAPRVFADPGFRLSLAAVVGVSQSFACVTAFVVPVLRSLGSSLVAAATIGIVPFAATMALASSLSRRLRWPPARSLAIGFGLQAVGLVLLYPALAAADPALVSLPGLLLVGLGIGFANPAVSVLAVIGVDPGDAAAAAAINNTVRQLGFTGGVALFSAISAASVAAVSVRPVTLAAAGLALFAAAWAIAGLGGRDAGIRIWRRCSSTVDER